MSLAIFGVLITSWAVVFDVLAIPKLVKYDQNKNFSEFNNLSSSLLIYTFLYLFSFQHYFIFW